MKAMKGWGVINPHGVLWPCSISLWRSLSIKRFVSNARYGYRANWRHARRRGFRCIRIKVTEAAR